MRDEKEIWKEMVEQSFVIYFHNLLFFCTLVGLMLPFYLLMSFHIIM